jgi:hypothetical protein
MCKGNDIQGKVEGSRSDRTDEPGEIGSVEAQAEKDRMTDRPAGGRCTPAERETDDAERRA